MRDTGRGEPGLGGRRRKEKVSGCCQSSQTKRPILLPAGPPFLASAAAGSDPALASASGAFKASRPGETG